MAGKSNLYISLRILTKTLSWTSKPQTRKKERIEEERLTQSEEQIEPS